MQVMTRAEARQRGRKMYYTGKPCPQGHVDLRYTDSCLCLECNRERNLERYFRLKEQKEARENEQHAYA
jgi:hypothetical protein